MPDLRQIKPGEQGDIARMLAAAFLDGPVGDWLIPHRDLRFQVYTPYFRIFTDYVAEQGIIHVTDDLSAAALWVDCYNNIDPVQIDGYDRKLARACGRWTPRFMLLDETFTQVHPHTPHWYLMFIGVRPDAQGHGVGTALLNRMTPQIAGAPVYLEASNSRNKTLYERHGFTPIREDVRLPEAGPPIWPMWRTGQ